MNENASVTWYPLQWVDRLGEHWLEFASFDDAMLVAERLERRLDVKAVRIHAPVVVEADPAALVRIRERLRLMARGAHVELAARELAGA